MKIEDFNNAEACLNKGGEEHRLWNSNGAIPYYDKAIKLSPDYAKAYNRRGVTKYALGEDAEAIKDFDKGIALDPSYTVAYMNRSVTKFRMGDYDGGFEDWMKAMELDPNITFEDFRSRLNQATDEFHPEYTEPKIERAIKKSEDINWRKYIESKTNHGGELISMTSNTATIRSPRGITTMYVTS